MLVCLPVWYYFLASKVLLDFDAIDLLVDYFIYQTLFQKEIISKADKILDGAS